MKAKIQIQNTKKVFKAFRKITEQQSADVIKAVAAATLSIELEAKKIVPVHHGVLKNSISSDISEEGFVGEVAANAEYATDVEMGTVYMNAQPYLFPSFEKVRPLFVKKLEKILSK